jgi:hypothetical protein
MDINLKGIIIGNHILNNLNKIIRNIIMVIIISIMVEIGKLIVTMIVDHKMAI